MEITRKTNNFNLKKTVELSVAGNSDFHFYVDELAADDSMPTYAGLADEKYSFDEMNDDFYDFLKGKIMGDGIYIRLVHAVCTQSCGKAVFELSHGNLSETFTSDVSDSIFAFEFADYGIKVKRGEITLGATVEEDNQTPYFAPFGSDMGGENYLSLDNPLNRRVLMLMEEMIVLDE